MAGDAQQRVGRIGQRAALVLVDPALHGVDVGDGCEVEASAPDEGADCLEEFCAERQIAGHRARLDHRGALPVQAHAFVVHDGGGHRDGWRRDGGIRAQAQVGAEHIAVGVARLHQGDKVACQARCEAAHRMAFGGFRVYWRCRIVEQHEVHIGRIIQFTGAQLAHAEDREPTAASRVPWIGKAELSRVMRGAQQVRHRQRQRGLGQVAERAGDALQRPDAADVRDGGGQGCYALGATERGRDTIATRGERAWRRVR